MEAAIISTTSKFQNLFSKKMLEKKYIPKIQRTIPLKNNEYIVMIDIPDENEGWTKHESNYNIYRVDQEYKIIWQVKELKTKPVSFEGEPDPFVYLAKNQKGEIIADRYTGFIYKIDPENGEATRIGFHK